MKQIRIDVSDRSYVVNKDRSIDDDEIEMVGLAKSSSGKQKINFKDFWLHPLLSLQLYPIFQHPTGTMFTGGRISSMKVLGVGSKANKK